MKDRDPLLPESIWVQYSAVMRDFALPRSVSCGESGGCEAEIL